MAEIEAKSKKLWPIMLVYYAVVKVQIIFLMNCIPWCLIMQLQVVSSSSKHPPQVLSYSNKDFLPWRSQIWQNQFFPNSWVSFHLVAKTQNNSATPERSKMRNIYVHIFFSSCSLKTRKNILSLSQLVCLSYFVSVTLSQFVYFLREVCLHFNFWRINAQLCVFLT